MENLQDVLAFYEKAYDNEKARADELQERLFQLLRFPTLGKEPVPAEPLVQMQTTGKSWARRKQKLERLSRVPENDDKAWKNPEEVPVPAGNFPELGIPNLKQEEIDEVNKEIEEILCKKAENI